MKSTPKLFIRLAMACLLFFGIGHSLGHFSRHQLTDPKAREVITMMKENKFDMHGTMRSYDDNYEGMSLNLIFVLLCLSVVLWVLSIYAKENPTIVRQVLAPIFLCILGFGITGWLFFFPLPAITCFAAAGLLGVAIVRLN